MNISNLIRRWKIFRGMYPKTFADCDLSPSCVFAFPQNLSLGRWIHIGPNSFIEAKGGVEIQDGAILSSRVTVLSSTHSYASGESLPYGGEDKLGLVRIGKGAWVGYGAILLPGVCLGDGAVVGAGSVVTKNVEAGTVVAGNPARVVGEREGKDWRALLEFERYRLRLKAGAT